MSADIVLLEVKNNVATVTLNRPDVHNAFDEHMIAALTKIFDELAGRADVRVVVLKGAGKSFSAGADLNWMKRAAGFTKEQNKADAIALATMLNKLNTLPKLTVALVQGAAMGGGFGLVSCCDIVIAAADAKFALSEVRLGLIPATIAPYVIAAIGPRHARRYFQTGERFTGVQAQAIGLVHEVAEVADDMPLILGALLDQVAANGPQAMAASKKLCLDITGRAVTPELMDDTATRIAQTRADDEAKEGLGAFLEKRKASWIK
jgi:methylglutaconyl-CoA hydratase